MTGSLEAFTSTRDIAPFPVGIPYRLQTNAVKEGTISLGRWIILRNVLYVPDLTVNLISIACLIMGIDCFVSFTHNLCILQNSTTRNPIGLSKMQEGSTYFSQCTAVAVTRDKRYDIWHQHMGHASHGPLSSITGIRLGPKPANKLCGVCCHAKQTREYFPASNALVLDLFSLVHCDIWGPYSISTHSVAHYFLTIVDDFSRSC